MIRGGCEASRDKSKFMVGARGSISFDPRVIGSMLLPHIVFQESMEHLKNAQRALQGKQEELMQIQNELTALQNRYNNTRIDRDKLENRIVQTTKRLDRSVVQFSDLMWSVFSSAKPFTTLKGEPKPGTEREMCPPGPSYPCPSPRKIRQGSCLSSSRCVAKSGSQTTPP